MLLLVADGLCPGATSGPISAYIPPDAHNPVSVLLFQNNMADLYNLAAHYWGGDKVSLHASRLEGDVFATFPIVFIRGNGINTWEYVLNVADMLVHQDTGLPGLIQNSTGETVDLAGAPTSGHFVYKPAGTF